MDEREARIALSCVVEGGTPALAQAVHEFGAVEVWAGLVHGGRDTAASRRARGFELGPVLASAAASGQRFVIPGDDEWPSRLSDLQGCESVNGMSGAPMGLWLRGAGSLVQLNVQSVAVVGSRASSAYGDTVAADLAATLGEGGWTVVSGGAYGIDAAAHRGCLASRTPTLAILAGGVDQPYPPGHRSLFERIAERGLLISELPPGEHPTRVRFLSRNRLIAALTVGTVIVEAASRSGARNTVTWANALRRVVMAVPGPVTSATSVTPHRLIRESEAVLVTQASDVFELLAPLGHPGPRRPAEQRPLDVLTPEELSVYEAIPGRGSRGAGEVALRSGLPLGHCLAVLQGLASQGFLVQDHQQEWSLPPRRAIDRPEDGNAAEPTVVDHPARG